MTKYHSASHDRKLPSVSGKLPSYARTRRTFVGATTRRISLGSRQNCGPACSPSIIRQSRPGRVRRLRRWHRRWPTATRTNRHHRTTTPRSPAVTRRRCRGVRCVPVRRRGSTLAHDRPPHSTASNLPLPWSPTRVTKMHPASAAPCAVHAAEPGSDHDRKLRACQQPAGCATPVLPSSGQQTDRS